MTIISLGEILWDVFPDGERLGGAPFNFAVHAHRLGHEVIFLSAVGDDHRGRRAREKAVALGLSTASIQVVPRTPTGIVSVRLDASGHPDFTIHRPAAYDALHLEDSELTRLAARQPAWIYYGTLHQVDPRVRGETRKLIAVLPNARRFYDVNLRRDSYTRSLVRELISLADAVKLNQEEAGEFPEYASCRVFAVTRGESGCAVRIGEDYAEAPGQPVKVVDTVGAGDAFAAAFLHGLSQGWDARRTADFANRRGAAVAARAGAIPEDL